MSADLLAEFGGLGIVGAPHEASAKRHPPVVRVPQTFDATNEEGNEWGDFESWLDHKDNGIALSNGIGAPATSTRSLGSITSRPMVSPGSMLDYFGNSYDSSFGAVRYHDTQALSSNVASSTSQRKPEHVLFELSEPSRHSVTFHTEVLFDADESRDDWSDETTEFDDFGDFETVSSSFPGPRLEPISSHGKSLSASKILSGPQTDLLCLDRPTFPYPEAPKSPSYEERNPFAGLSIATRSEIGSMTRSSGHRRSSTVPAAPAAVMVSTEEAIPSPVIAWPVYRRDSGNDRFDPYMDSPTTTEARHQLENDDEGFNEWTDSWGPSNDAFNPTPTITQLDTGILRTEGLTSESIDMPSHPPESTIPLTSVAPTSAAATLQGPTVPRISETLPIRPANIPPPSHLLSLFLPPKNLLLPPPSHSQTLPPHLASLAVLSRILAGRRLRPQRSAFLSASISIGPASSGLKSGMKLTRLSGSTGSDRREEDRVVEDILEAWRAYAGKIKTALVRLGRDHMISSATPLKVPLITHSMERSVQTASAAQGGVQDEGGRECAICGLHRYERVKGLDDSMAVGADSFGEFWVSSWGHVACKTWWDGVEPSLWVR